MLSWVLASASSTPSAPAHQSRTIVTGRVCKNTMGLFASNSHETLEVKLRLVPVPTCLQSEYIESMKSYRDLSRVMPEAFDAQAWTNFIQANPGILQLVTQSRSQSPAIGAGQKGNPGIEQVQRLFNQGHGSENQGRHDLPPQTENCSAREAIAQLPRPASQASSVKSSTAPRRRGRPPKAPSGRPNRNQSSQRTDSRRRESIDTGYASNEDQFDEGSNRKRAKVTRVDSLGTIDFGKQPESLRVAASTAASLRIHQPTAIRPAGATADSSDGPPREPTPIAIPPPQRLRPKMQSARSHLGQQSVVTDNMSYKSPYPASEDNAKPPPSETSSPAGSRVESSNTPADIASSPPVFPGASTTASSPRLPTLPRDYDSGFMSGSFDDLFEDNELRPLDDEDIEVAAKYLRRPDLPTDQPSHAKTTETQSKGSPNEPQDRLDHEGQESGNLMTANNVSESHCFGRTVSSGFLAPDPVEDCTLRPSVLNRSQTWSGQANFPSSDTAFGSGAPQPASKIRPRNRTGSGAGAGAKRKQAIQSKLEASIAAGEMPPFCENCGSVETPTWRKAWIKVHSGSPEHVVISEDDGGIVSWQSLQKDDKGAVILYRIIKRSLLPTDEGFKESLLCNPCGLWLHTRKCMRPEEAWDKNNQGPNGRGGPRKRTSQSTKQHPGSSVTLQAGAASNNSAFYSDVSSPVEGNDQNKRDTEAPKSLANQRIRASSNPNSPSRARMNNAMAAAALERAIQSSPVRFRRPPPMPRKSNDLTPKPTRRILFPSPHQSGGAGGADAKGSKSNTCCTNCTAGESCGKRMRHDPANKENRPPQDVKSEVVDSFPAIPHPVRSTTPTPVSKADEQILRTPDRNTSPSGVMPTTGDFFSSAAKALLHPPLTPKRTPTRSNSQPLQDMTPFTAHLNQLLSDAHTGSPKGNHFDLPSLPSLSSTPGRMRQGFDFSHLDAQDILSTDVPMPSSPPAWFGVYEDSGENGGD
ncbi:MAG: hypothetical protein Q9190_006682, partial [Brigantiaea leucoxantha]